jgi:histidine triad (HIT) family protein
MKDCLFCKIINGDIPSKKVYEDDNVFAFLDINPKAPGHTMVIPKKHVSNILELQNDLVPGFFISAKKVIKMIYDSLNPDGFTLGFNQGEIAGQEVSHLHFHIIPRFENDGGSCIQGVVDNKPNESLDDIAEKIRLYK